MFGAYICTMFISSWWILPLSIMKLPSGFHFMDLVLKSILSGLFFLSVCLEYIIQTFTFSLCMSFFLSWVSCRQHMCGSCFLIHSAILCLLIGAFNPFMFKVIIDKYSLPFFLFLCSSLFHCFSSCSQSKPFSISYRAVLQEVYFLRLLLSEKILIWPSILIESLAG